MLCGPCQQNSHHLGQTLLEISVKKQTPQLKGRGISQRAGAGAAGARGPNDEDQRVYQGTIHK